MMKSLRLTSAIMCALVLSVTSACGGVADPGNSGSATPLSAAHTLGPEFGACADPPGETSGSVSQFLAGVSGWIPIIDSDAVVEATRAPSGERWTFPAVIRRPDGLLETVRIHASFWPGIDWGLANKANVWLAMADASVGADLVAYVVVVASDGSVFFPGECSETLIRQPMIQSFGSEYSDLARAMAGKTPSEIDTLLQVSSGAGSTPEASPEVVILNPEMAPHALLASLQRVVIHVRLQTPLGPNFTICTKASVGWNDCLVADETAGPGVVVGGYVAADRRLEVWLLDEQANLAQPIRHIGDVLVPVDFAKVPQVALDLAVSVDGVSPGTTPRAGDRVTLLDAVTTDALSSTDWPGLSNGGGTVAPAQPGNE
jgi:hypothetical protein